ncbi:hypothetical protein JYK14_05765 [Siccirubricoccus sp. KC 17139]|uniref:Transmembrane protein n=1 Tax=Siccirubricoccus soli TaxID=2899147 RepID=A0ABT1D192_9PROT|nr:hypothetical protein [Siccirubricoccus soli]MCO6415685.1 hypothetical protein [Siccirubricoccus soli]MCP2681817.1 hypothetical protein [Siccirubricoccus soli]
MASSLSAMAEEVDGWAEAKAALVTETDDALVVDRLNADHAIRLCQLLQAEGWPFVLEDETQSHSRVEDISQDFEPYRIRADKPDAPANVSLIVTNAGLSDWLRRAPSAPVAHVARIKAPFVTRAVRFTFWGDRSPFEPTPLSADPRRIVREATEIRRVPGDLSPWLLNDPNTELDWSCLTLRTWAELAAIALIHALASEIEAGGYLVFRGPPILRLRIAERNSEMLGRPGFADVQRAAHWVYDNEREAENRHGLYAAEMARTAVQGSDAGSVFKKAAAPALEGAKIAYQLGISQLSRDSLKAMADLRKAVSDEAAKLSDTTRQLASAAATATFAGIGVITARLTVPFGNEIVAAAVIVLGIILSAYIAAVIVSSYQFVLLQRGLRLQWRDKLYRFLPDHEYDVMVSGPAEKAERVFKISAWISGLLAFVLLIVVVVIATQAPIPTPTETLTTTPPRRPLEMTAPEGPDVHGKPETTAQPETGGSPLVVPSEPTPTQAPSLQ